MKYKGIVFDFNGTLLRDMDIHEIIWNEISMDIRGKAFTEEEFHRNVHGRTNREIYPFLMEKELIHEEADILSEQKEQRYRDYLMEHAERLKLVAGAEEFFGKCLENGIKIAIGTAANKANVDFYSEIFKLHRWFEKDNIIHDDGTLPGKPHPAIFQKAMASIGVEAQECLIVEDGSLGIEAAHSAGAGRVVGIWSDEIGRAKLETASLYRIIHSFEEMGMDDFK
jgi:beta-phosphoglucomutase